MHFPIFQTNHFCLKKRSRVDIIEMSIQVIEVPRIEGETPGNGAEGNKLVLPDVVVDHAPQADEKTEAPKPEVMAPFTKC